MTSLSKLQRFITDMGYDLYEFEKFFRDGLNYSNECEERAIKQFAGNILRSIIAITYEITDEDFLAGDDERIEEAIALCFNQYRDKRDDRRSPESKSAAKADYQRSLAHG